MSLEAISSDRALLKGALTVHSTAALAESGAKLIAKANESWTLDMAQVSEVSSAAVALLLYWLRAARAQNKAFYIENLPQALLPILAISDLEPLFAPLLRPRA